MSTPEPPFSQIPDIITPQEPAPQPPGATAFGLPEVFLVFVVAVFSTLGVGLVMVIVFLSLHMKFGSAVKDLKYLLAMQGTAYVITIAFVYRMAVKHFHQPFGEAVAWRCPRRWARFLMLGAALSVAVQASLSVLPVPKHLPVDDFFKTATDAWMMTIFGVFIAPFFEELIFRGLLFPALRRHISTVLAVLITSAGFAAIHADQLGKSWIPVMAIFVVGVVFTLVRHRTESLAASVFTHMGYNGFLFVIAMVQTGGYRHMERLTQ